MRILKKCDLRFLIVTVVFMSLNTLPAQKYSLNQSQSKVEVKGTSNLHDWELQATRMQGEINLELEQGVLTGITNLQLSITAESLESGKSGMDKNTFKALKTDDYPTITYRLKSVEKITPQSDHYLLETKGSLNIAGVTKPVSLSFTARLVENGIALSGSKQLQMTDFNVEPPTALFGTIKTGDTITIQFKTSFFKSIN